MCLSPPVAASTWSRRECLIDLGDEAAELGQEGQLPGLAIDDGGVI